MRSAILVLAAVALTGCIAAPTAPLEGPAGGVASASQLAEPTVATWNGRITASELGMLAHSRDTETLVADVQREGFVFDITEPPTEFRVDLAWPGGEGMMLVMVSTPHVDGKGQEYFTKMSAEAAQCLRIPPAEIVPGAWQIMAHSDGVKAADFTFTVTTVGGTAAILEGEPHSSAEAAETTEAEALPCDEPAA